DSLLSFSQTVLKLREETGVDTADLNWARIEGWRELIASLFHSGEHLDKIKNVRITYNARETEFFCHLKVQSLYLLSWLSSRLQFKFKIESMSRQFPFENQEVGIQSTVLEKLGPRSVISVDLSTEDGFLFQSVRVKNEYLRVSIQISSAE